MFSMAPVPAMRMASSVKASPRARAQAASLAGQVLLEGSGRFWDGQPWSVQVTDERGLTLFELHLSATSAPATVNLGSYQKPLG
jgi:hypothetical protein